MPMVAAQNRILIIHANGSCTNQNLSWKLKYKTHLDFKNQTPNPIQEQNFKNQTPNPIQEQISGLYLKK